MMFKSFYYPIEWKKAKDYVDLLSIFNIPYSIEQNKRLELGAGQVAIVFPDLPVRDYDKVFKILGGPGTVYPPQ